MLSWRGDRNVIWQLWKVKELRVWLPYEPLRTYTPWKTQRRVSREFSGALFFAVILTEPQRNTELVGFDLSGGHGSPEVRGNICTSLFPGHNSQFRNIVRSPEGILSSRH
jgi:hypothetical protein